ncbi:MAG: DUF6483 family protein [Defluviitaleaceae bacterium]|nr:DUF6483 family protein [Defluviitaleaceae bacterium]
MLKEGFIDQQIKVMATALGKTFFNQERLVHEMTDPYRNEAANDLNKRLLDLLADGNINEAEDVLFQAVEHDVKVDHDYLRVALNFYLTLDQYDDDYLALCHFSRSEAHEGWSALTQIFPHERGGEK